MLLPGAIMAQILNAGFENWTGNVPNNWTTNNIAPLDLYPVTPSSDSHSGSLAAKGEVIDNTLGTSDVYPPLIQGNVSSLPEDPSVLTGWYRFSTDSPTSSLVISATAVDANGGFTGFAAGQFYDEASSYSYFYLAMDYSFGSGNPAVSVTISATIADDEDEPLIGTWFLLDDLSLLYGTVGLNEPSQVTSFLSVSEAFPQPFSQSTSFSLKMEKPEMISVDIVDVQGKLIETIFNETLRAGEHIVTWIPQSEIPSGLYLARINTRNESVSRTLVLQRE